MARGQLTTTEFSSAVGPWRLMQWLPSSGLSQAVKALWAVEGSTRQFRERVVPRGTVELMVNLGSPHSILDPDSERPPSLYRHAWISGLQQKCLLIESASTPLLIAASIQPAFASVMTGACAEELAGGVVEWEDVSGDWVRALRQRLLEAPRWEERFLLFERFLAGRLGQARVWDEAPVWAVGELLKRGGLILVSALSDQVGLSHKQFIERFRRAVGFTPKIYARLIRFERLIETVTPMRRVNWADVALGLGYYDQAHFNREFRDFTGATPTEYLEQRDPSGQSMIAEPLET